MRRILRLRLDDVWRAGIRKLEEVLMPLNRREFVAATSSAVASAAIGANATTPSTSPDFSIEDAFAQFMRDIGGSPTDAGGTVTFTGRDPILRSHFRIGTSMALPAMAAAVGAAAIWRERTGTGQDVRVDLREAVYNVNPLMTPIMQFRIAAGLVPANDPVPASFTFMPSINGRFYQAPIGLGNPFSFVPWETKDGRYVNITAVYPHLEDRALTILGAVPTRESIAKSVKKWDALALEDAMAEARAVGAIHRTTEEWMRHSEGQLLASVPVIDIRKVGDSAPVPFPANPSQPLSGIKGLALTHVIAGSCAARTLSEYGADLLQVVRDQSFEHDAIWTDVNVGMRSTLLDLTKADQVAALAALLPKADVFIESFSGRGVERLGFGVEEVVSKKPGIIYLTVRAYGWDGPWKNRGGFDMEALTVTGYTYLEGGRTPEFPPTFLEYQGGGSARPAFPPTLVLNDYIAGYLGAAGVIAALRRRAREGGSYHVRVSLSRAAMWYQSLGRFPTTEFDATNPEHRMIPPESVTAMTCYGEVQRLAPLAKLSRTPGRWREPLLVVRGGDKPVWLA
jgi:crotonobetainyl-CoA:carnitine CoA-transferase CaiB-like acyl-CoA transferase